MSERDDVGRRCGATPARPRSRQAGSLQRCCCADGRCSSLRSHSAHDVRPGYLSLTERDAGRFDVLFKVPASGETQLALEARLPPACRETSPRDWQAVAGATVERWTIDCGADGLESGEVSIGGLELTLTDVLLRVEWRDGSRFSTVLRPEAPAIRPDRSEGDGKATVPAAGFLRLGVEHILGGVDHLLFVLCLVLLVDGARRLLVTITAFTLAHSVTLALATLGVVRVPSRPVEAVDRALDRAARGRAGASLARRGRH